MFDLKVLIVILVIAMVVFGTKRLRSIGSDLGGAMKGFKQAMHDGESAAEEPPARNPVDR